MEKHCVFDKNKVCNDCGECYICDLNANKRCNNCGKCLELEGYDVKAIQIDDLLEDSEDVAQYEELDQLHNDANKELKEDGEFWHYIDDVKDLKDLIESDNEFNSDFVEIFPGLISYKKEEK